MAKREGAPYSEEVDIPFEIFQSYFEEKRRLTVRHKFLVAASMASIILLLVSTAVSIALPFLLPVLAGGIIGTIYVAALVPTLVGVIPAIGLFFSWVLSLKAPNFSLYQDLSFKKAAIKVQMLNSSSCLFVPNGFKTRMVIQSNLDKNLSLPLVSTQKNISIIFKDMIKILTSKQEKLEKRKQGILSYVKGNLRHNIKELPDLNHELNNINNDAKKNSESLEILRNVTVNFAFKESVEMKCIHCVSQLSSFLKRNEECINNLSHLAVASNEIEVLQDSLRSTLKEELNTIIRSIRSAKEYLAEQEQGASLDQINFLKYSVRQIDTYLQSISEVLLKIDPGFFVEFCPEQATQYYFSLLNNPSTNPEAFLALNKMLTNYPSSDAQVNQTVNFILANYLVGQLRLDRTEALRAQACQAVLKLNSDNENNKNLKEAVLLYAFYEHKNLSELPTDILDLVQSSHADPKAYHKLKEQIEGHSPQRTLKFSNLSEHNTDLEKTDTELHSDSSFKANKPPH